jgi:glycosyltransferase involved in cell wall biosynthesis
MSESQEIRVMFVTNSPSGGGAERATNILVDALHELNVKVSLTTINRSEPDLVVPTCETFQINRTWQGGPISVLFAYLRFRKIVNSWKPSHLVLECDLPEFFGSFIKGNYKKIVVLQSSKPWITRLKFGEKIRRRLQNQNVLWVAVSNHFNVWYFESEPDEVISNPLILSNLDRVIQNQLNKSISRIVYIGRLSDEKQPAWILDIANASNLPILMVGDGVLRSQLELKSKNLKLDTEFTGYVTKPWELISQGDLLIVPSQYEGDGLVVVEAIARKIPILLHDIPDLRRFNLPFQHYGLGVSEFSKRISQYRDSIESLVVSEELTEAILLDRNPIEIAKKWILFLKEKS